MKFNAYHGTALIAFLLGLWMFVRITLVHNQFQHTVRQSLMSSEGYDQKFIDLVNHLEDVLTTRASFSYPGGKDPMTGRQREVAEYVPAAPVKRSSVSHPASTGGTAGAAPSSKVGSASTGPAATADLFRLTALIADDFGRYTAIVMNGERSMSVDVGDLVGNRRVLRISAKEIVLTSETEAYTYGLNGGRSVAPK
jgi:hypothetical protein